jgi:hypothetical protein
VILKAWHRGVVTKQCHVWDPTGDDISVAVGSGTRNVGQSPPKIKLDFRDPSWSVPFLIDLGQQEMFFAVAAPTASGLTAI